MLETFYGYHVVTERPMYLGQHIVFNESHRSGVYQRVMERKEIVKLKVTGSKCVGDATKCFYATIHKDENLEMAEKYWRNEENSSDEPPIKEILVGGDIEVVEIVKEYTDVSGN